MNWQQIIQLLLIIVICSTTTLIGQSNVYPGDVNNNGIVSGVDFLYLASVYNQTGAERDQEEQDNYSSVDTEWDGNFPNGVNHTYADCNGDGKVNYDDISSGILTNFGKHILE